MLFSFFQNFVKLKLINLFSRLISFFLFSIEFLKSYKKLPIDPTPAHPTLTRTTARRPLTREGEYVVGGGVGGTSWLEGTSWLGVRGGTGVQVEGTSWVGGYVGRGYIGRGHVGGCEELVKNAVFGHFLENYHILA